MIFFWVGHRVCGICEDHKSGLVISKYWLCCETNWFFIKEWLSVIVIVHYFYCRCLLVQQWEIILRVIILTILPIIPICTAFHFLLFISFQPFPTHPVVDYCLLYACHIVMVALNVLCIIPLFCGCIAFCPLGCIFLSCPKGLTFSPISIFHLNISKSDLEVPLSQLIIILRPSWPISFIFSNFQLIEEQILLNTFFFQCKMCQYSCYCNYCTESSHKTSHFHNWPLFCLHPRIYLFLWNRFFHTKPFK